MPASGGELQWFVSRNGGQHGPLATHDMLQLARSGHLLTSDHVWMTGAPDWVPAADVLQLLAPPAPATGLPQQLGFSEALAMQRSAPAPAATRADAERAVPAATHVPHLARSLTRMSEGSALAAWKAARTEQHIAQTSSVRTGSRLSAQPDTQNIQAPLASRTAPRQLEAAGSVPAVAGAANGVPVPASTQQLVPAERPTAQGLLQQVTGVFEAVRSKVDEIAAWAPGQLQAAFSQMQVFGWNDLVAALGSAFERMQVRTIADLMDDTRMRDAARVVLDSLPWSARTCIMLTIGEAGMESLVLRIRDWLRGQIPQEYLRQDIGPLLQHMLGSEAIEYQFRSLFDDFKQRLMQPLTAQQVLTVPTMAPAVAMLPRPTSSLSSLRA